MLESSSAVSVARATTAGFALDSGKSRAGP